MTKAHGATTKMYHAKRGSVASMLGLRRVDNKGHVAQAWHVAQDALTKVCQV